MRKPRPSTFSVAGFDPSTKDLGIAVASKFVAVGAVVPWAKAGVGAIATQAFANTSYGPLGLELLRQEKNAPETLKKLLEADAQRESRQVGIVDAKGNAASHTGSECHEWAGHVIGQNFCCQGNILASEAVVKSMAEAYQKAEGDLIDKLFAALEAGDASGGDRRGRQSAALLVVREKGGYEGFNDRYVDLRVDDHPQPINELRRVFQIYDMTMLSREDSKNLHRIEGRMAAEVQELLSKLGYYKGPKTEAFDQLSQKALENFVHVNNFENKMRNDGRIWESVLNYMRELAATGSSG